VAQNTIAAQDASRASFEASIEAAKRHAERTGEPLNDVLDRLDRADAAYAPANPPLVRGDRAPLAQRIRGALWIDPNGRRTINAPRRTLRELFA